jgi:hypothetical protein
MLTGLPQWHSNPIWVHELFIQNGNLWGLLKNPWLKWGHFKKLQELVIALKQPVIISSRILPTAIQQFSPFNLSRLLKEKGREQFWPKKGNLRRTKTWKIDRISLLLGSIKFFPTSFNTFKGGHGSETFFLNSWMELDEIFRVLSRAYPDQKNIIISDLPPRLLGYGVILNFYPPTPAHAIF